MKVFLTNTANRQKNKLPKAEQKKVEKQLAYLGEDPLSGKKLLGKYKGLRSLRVWPYRIIYSIDKNKKEIWIVSILHRQGAYN